MANEDHRVGFDRLFASAGVGLALNSARAALGATAYAGAVSRASNALAAAMPQKSWLRGSALDSVMAHTVSAAGVQGFAQLTSLQGFGGSIGAVATEQVRLSAFEGIMPPRSALAEALASMNTGAFAFANSPLGAGALAARIPTFKALALEGLVPTSQISSILSSPIFSAAWGGAGLTSAYSARYRQLPFQEDRVERAAAALAAVDDVIASSEELESALEAAHASTHVRGSFGPAPSALLTPLEATEAVLRDSPSLRSDLVEPLEDVLEASDLDAPGLRDQFDRIGLHRSELIGPDTANAWGLFAGTTIGTLVAVGLNGVDGLSAAAVWEAFGTGAATYGAVRFRLRR